jgi:hypothetical protein
LKYWVEIVVVAVKYLVEIIVVALKVVEMWDPPYWCM